MSRYNYCEECGERNDDRDAYVVLPDTRKLENIVLGLEHLIPQEEF